MTKKYLIISLAAFLLLAGVMTIAFNDPGMDSAPADQPPGDASPPPDNPARPDTSMLGEVADSPVFQYAACPEGVTIEPGVQVTSGFTPVEEPQRPPLRNILCRPFV